MFNLKKNKTMKKFQFITSEFISGEHARYIIEASCFQEACKQASALGILKGHLLRRFDGKWEKVKACYQCEMSHIWDRDPAGKVVFRESENYWQPDSLVITRVVNGTFTAVFISRTRRKTVRTGLNLLKAWKMAKNYCQDNRLKFCWGK